MFNPGGSHMKKTGAGSPKRDAPDTTLGKDRRGFLKRGAALVTGAAS